MTRDHSGVSCRVELTCHAPGASSVLLVASFEPASTEPLRMAPGPDGEWRTVVDVPPGEHRYKYVVVYDGSLRLADHASHGAVHQLCTESAVPLPDCEFWPAARHAHEPVVYGGTGGFGRAVDATTRWQG